MVKTAAGFVMGIIALLLLLQLVIIIPAVQNKLKNISVSALQEQLNCNVSIGQFRLGFPKELQVGEILISKNHSDTLFFLDKFSVNIEILPLLKHEIVVGKIELIDGKGDFGRLLGQLKPDSIADKNSEDNTPSWEFIVNNLNIESFYFEYKDTEDTGFELVMDIGNAVFHIGKLNFDTLISCKYLDFNQTSISYEQLNIPKNYTDEDTSALEFANIYIEEAHLNNTEFEYIDSVGAIIFATTGEEVDVSNLLVDVTNESVIINEGFAKNTTTSVVFLPESDTAPETSDYLNWGQYLWRVEGNVLDIDGYKLTVDYLGEPEPSGHFNNKHLNIYDVEGKLSNFILDADTLIVKINDVSGKEINGLEIVELVAEMKHNSNDFVIQDMQMETTNSKYSANLVTNISPTNYNELEGKTINLAIEIESKNWNDIDYFYSFIDSNNFLSKDFINNEFGLNTVISGSLDSIGIENLNFYYLDSTQVVLNGNIVEMMDPESSKYSLRIDKLMLSKNNFEDAFNNQVFDSSFSLPDYFIIDGSLSGNANKLKFNGIVESDVGSLIINKLDIVNGSFPEYIVDVNANLKNLKKITSYELDNAVFNLAGEFNGNDFYSSTGQIELIIDRLNYNNYNYHKLDINGEIANGKFTTKVTSLDSNFLFNFSANGNLSAIRQDIQIEIVAERIDLYATNILDEEFRFKGDAVFAINASEGSTYGGVINMQNFDVCFSDTLYKMHPFDLSFATNDTNTNLNLKSYYYNLDFRANNYIEDIANSFIDLPKFYLEKAQQDSVEFYLPEFQISGNIDYPEAFARLFFPGFPDFKKLTIDGSYNNRDEITLNMFVSGANYNAVFADSIMIQATGSSKELQYKCLANIMVNDLVNGKLNLSGNFNDSDIISNFRYYDGFSNQYINITSKINSTTENTAIHIMPDSLVLNYNSWFINSDNRIILNNSNLLVNNFNLNSDNQQISITSFPTKNPLNLELNIQDFNLASLEHLLNLDTLVTSKLSANVKLLNLYNKPTIEGNLTVDNIFAYGIDVGKLTISNIVAKDNSVSGMVAVAGQHEDILVSGNYGYAKDSDSIDLTIDIKKLDLSDFNYLLSDEIENASGNLAGKMKIVGELENPIANGDLFFTDAKVGIKTLNNHFTLGNETIKIRDNVVDFDDFSIVNKQNQSANITGNISFGANEETYSDLLIKTDNMEIMNSKREDNDIMYGLLKSQATIEIKGTPKSKQATVDVTIDKSTNLTYVFPDEMAVNDNRGVVRYYKYNPDSAVSQEIPDHTAFANFTSFNSLKSKIEIEEGAHIKLFFDESGNNFLDAKVGGTINYEGIEENTEVSGMFIIQEGKLHYEIPMVTVEDYKIESGSFITFTNDVYNPHLNIIASSEVRASTEGLMDDYNKVITFKVMIYMVGELNNVKLRFDLSSEVSDALVSAQISNLSSEERNVNALNLLARGAFVINVHGTEAGGTSMINAQIDKFYAEQLNHLISENIHFVDLHFDVQSFTDYSQTGDQIFRRNYYYNIGKGFFNDMARINYKGSIGFSSDMKAEQINTNFVQNELDIEFNLTKDGAYKAVFFRKNEYEGILEGEIIETGGGIRLQKNFFSVKDIFINHKKQNKKQN